MSKVKQLIFETAFNTYRGLSQIGSGGAGVVVKVQDENDAIFAVKYLSPNGLSQEKVKRFKNELSFCAANKHSNIICIHDWGKIDINGKKHTFYVMPYYAGNLRDLMKVGIPNDKVLPYFAQILNGVEAAHFQDVWHRDLKPENVLFESTTDTLVIADFGIARFSESQLQTLVETQPNARLANFQYAAPEQRERNADVDSRADIYALGLLLNEMFTKKLAHGVGFMSIRNVADQYAYLDSIVNLMLSQSPNSRPKSIADIKRQLIARQNEFVSLQKLSELKQQVVPNSEVDDPLVANTTTLVDARWEDGQLIMKLNQQVNFEWTQFFKDPSGTYEWVTDKHPKSFKIAGDTISVYTGGNDAQKLIEYTKQYIQKANAKYKHIVERDAREQEREMKEELIRQIQLEEETRKTNLDLEI